MAGPGNSKSSGKRKYQHATAQQQQAQATANFSLAKARSVDVTGFVESRSFEINALQRSLDNSSNNGMARAFQTLPRHLRRRAASHNVKRIPKRLRDKAISEMKKSAMSSKKLDGTGKLTNAKSGNRYKRRRTRSVREEYELRQRGKRWLETHVWHAKRMHMEERWGTMVARTPNERSHRAAYRAAKEKAFVEDVSYFAMLQVVGPQEQIVKALETMMAKGVVTVAMERFLRGGRAAPVTFYRAGKAPLDCLGPALAIWKPQQSGDSSRTLWIRAHPAISASVVEEINKASQFQSCASVSVEDITTDLVAFELLGGQSTPLLASIISPNICDPEGTGGKLVNTIANTPSPASLPEGSVIALRIHDPRLKFPYKLEKTDERPTEHEQKELADLMLHWPKDTNQFSQDSSDAGIWDIAQTRNDLERRISEHQLNERRRDILVPGTKLTPDPLIDVTVPLLLIRTGPEALLGSPSSTLDSEYVDSLAHGWTVLAPRGWGMPLWLSFIFAGARAQGYQERHHIAFEAGLPIFPLHWPGTRSYDDWVGPIAHDDYLRWSRRPMAKRENYLKHGVKSPFFPPFHQLLGLQGIPAQYPVVSSDDLECRKDRICAIKEKKSKAAEGSSQDAEMQISVDEHNSSLDPIWVAAGERLALAIRKMLTRPRSDVIPFEQWAEPVLAQLADSEATPLLERCLVRVRLDCSGRGTPDKNARVCVSEDDSEQIGYVMTGSFSLARGSGMAIGACSLHGLYDMWRREAHTVVVKNNNGGPTRSAYLKVLP